MRKANLIVGLGPITQDDINNQSKNNNDYSEAKVKAALTYLRTRLMYNDEELEKIHINETQTAKDDTLYIALTCAQDVKDIYIRKSEVRDDTTWTRNFIPPQVHAKYMFLNKACKNYRETYKEMKTQVRFGHFDLEVLVKPRGSTEPFREIEITEIVDVEAEAMPDFDFTIKWKSKTERQPRRKIQPGQPISVSNLRNGDTGQIPKPIRQLSVNSSDNIDTKRLRSKNDMEIEDDVENEDDMEDEEEEVEDEDDIGTENTDPLANLKDVISYQQC